MTISTAETLYDFIGEESGSAKPTGDATNQVSMHREFKLDATDGEQQLFLTFRDTETGTYHIPLGTFDSHEKTDSNNHKNVIVPIVPAIYTTPDLDSLHADIPREGCYVYIFKGDYLWRELGVIKSGKYVDVNLHKYQGKDVRPPMSEDSDTRILMPFKIGGKSETLTMCISEVQWSWARINTMGGMDPYDFRLNKKNPPLLAEAYDITKAIAKTNRDSRMQEVDLSGHDAYFPQMLPSGNKARIENSNSVSSYNFKTGTFRLKTHSNSNIAVVYLHDSIGVARSNIGKVMNVKARLINLVEQISKKAHYKSAVLAYKTFFDEKLQEKNKAYSPCDDVDTDAFVNDSKRADILRECRTLVDETLIKKILDVKARKEVRKVIRDLKIIHVEFMDSKYKEKKLTDTCSDFISVNECLKDFAELEAPTYGEFWKVYMELVSIMPFDPSVLDKALDVEKDHDQTPRLSDLGNIYLKSILVSSHPLHEMLFPSNAQVDEFSPNYKIDTTKIEKVNGAGKFRPQAYAQTFKESAISIKRQKKEKVQLNLLEKTIGDLTILLNAQVSAPKSFIPDPTVPKIEINPFIRLSIALNDPELQSLHIVKAGASLKGLLVLDGRFTILEKLRRSQKEPVKYGKPTNKPGKASGLVNVIDPNTNKPIGSCPLDQIKLNKGMPPDMSSETWNSLFVNQGTTEPKAVATFVVVEGSSKIALKILEGVEIAKDSPIGKVGLKKIVDFANSKLPSLMLIFDMINIYSSYQSLIKSKSLKDSGKLILSSSALPFAIISATESLLGKQKALDFWIKKIGEKRATRLLVNSKNTTKFLSMRLLTQTNIVFAGAGAFISGWDMLDAIMVDDYDAAIAYGVQMVAGVGMAMSAFGLASSATTGILYALGPYGWAFLAVVIISGILASMFTDSKLEQWAKHGPLAKTEGIIFKTSPMIEAYQGKSANFAHEVLLGLLMTPVIIIKHKINTNLFIVDVRAGGLEPGESTLTIDAKISDSPPEFDFQKDLDLIGWTPLLDKKMPSITRGMRYIYQASASYRGYVKLFARVQHITKEGYIIPVKPDNKNTKIADPNKIDNTINGWAYANQGRTLINIK